MKRLFPLVMVVAAAGCNHVPGSAGLGSGMFGSGMTGIGDVKTETRNVGRFTKIESGSIFHVHVHQADRTSVVVSAQANVLPIIATDVEGDTLVLKVKKPLSTSKEVVVDITTPTLKGIDVSGVSVADIHGFREESFDATVSGAAQLDAEASAQKLGLHTSGASKIKFRGFHASSLNLVASGNAHADLVGSSYTASIECSGSSSVGTKQLSIGSVDVSLGGNSQFEATISKGLKAETSGASHLAAMGTAEKAVVECSGSSSFDASDLRVGDAQISTSGASSASIQVDRNLVAKASGASSVRYKGTPHVIQTTSGASHVGPA